MKTIVILFLLATELVADEVFAQGWEIQYDNFLEEYYDLHFINEYTGWAIETYSTGKILKTTNKGEDWIEISSGQFHDGTGIYFVNNTYGWISGSSGQLYRTSNGGYNWILSDCGSCNSTDDFIDIQFINEFTGWAYGDLGVFKSTNGGVNYFEQPNWSFVFNGIFLDSMNGFTVARSFISKSTDGGSSWKRDQIPVNYCMGIYFINVQTGWVCTSEGEIFKTENSGLNWVSQPINNTSLLFKIQFVNENTGWVIGNDGKIFKTINGGNNWYQQTSPATGELRGIFMLNSQEGWICGKKYILYTNDGGGPVGINNVSQIVPDNYKLYQNYPNPFNPVTMIKFDVKGQTSNVKLVIYDALGKEVNTLVNDKLDEGSYEVNFEGGNLPSGVYFYQLTTGNFTDTKKMFLVK